MEESHTGSVSLDAVWTGANFSLDPTVSFLLAHCPVLAALKDKVDRHGRLDYEELSLLQHTLGHLPTGLLAASSGERNRRPPKDPINACLSFAYALLATIVEGLVLQASLDPLLGALQQPAYGRP